MREAGSPRGGGVAWRSAAGSSCSRSQLTSRWPSNRAVAGRAESLAPRHPHRGAVGADFGPGAPELRGVEAEGDHGVGSLALRLLDEPLCGVLAALAEHLVDPVTGEVVHSADDHRDSFLRAR